MFSMAILSRPWTVILSCKLSPGFQTLLHACGKSARAHRLSLAHVVNCCLEWTQPTSLVRRHKVVSARNAYPTLSFALRFTGKISAVLPCTIRRNYYSLFLQRPARSRIYQSTGPHTPSDVSGFKTKPLLGEPYQRLVTVKNGQLSR